MKKKNLYIIGVALLMAGCTNDAELVSKSNTLSGGDKTPLKIEAAISTDRAGTRAYDNYFEEGDKLLVYLRHTTGVSEDTYTTISANQAPKLVTLTSTNTVESEATVFNEKYYWDDFSESNPDLTSGYGDKDLRTSGHGLQAYYGYCYNGGTPTTLTEETGELGWTVSTDQKTSGVKSSDLLWAKEQKTVQYAHSTSVTGDHKSLVIPFTHAMSEVTVTLTAGTGFSADTNPLASTDIVLKGVNTVATLKAPAGKVTSDRETSGDITMYKGDVSADKLQCNYTAIIAPGTVLMQGNLLLNINNVDGDDYMLNITSSMVNGPGTWADADAESNGGDGTSGNLFYVTAQPGYNYHIDVTVNKSQIIARTTLADWTTVTATGEAEIVYPDDCDKIMDDSEIGYPGTENINVDVIDENKFKNGSSFSMFSLKNESGVSETLELRKTNVGNYIFSTISQFNNPDEATGDKWENTPPFYWLNTTDEFYFRALAKFKGLNDSNQNILESVGTSSDVGKKLSELSTFVSVSQGSVADGHDILWGTTASHKGTTSVTYNRGAKIKARRGGVPFAFFHAMSKITITLKTTDNGETNDRNNPKVNFTGATIAISNLSTDGTMSLETGDITKGGNVVDAIPQATVTEVQTTTTATAIKDLLVIPQTITDESIVTITLKDGTVYKLQLNQCPGSDTTPITAWERGKHYSYTITVEKEAISFRAVVKDWVETTGSGKAFLEWD